MWEILGGEKAYEALKNFGGSKVMWRTLAKSLKKE